MDADAGTGTAPERVRSVPSWLLGRANARAHQLLVEHLEAVGVRPYHYRLLNALEERGELTQADLGRAAWLDPSDVVGAMKELEAGGFVVRTPDPAHGRRLIVSLTPQGRLRMGDLHAALEAAQEAILDPLAPDERSELVRLLTTLISAPDRRD